MSVVSIEINSTWKFNKVEGIEDGVYRVLDILTDISAVVVFDLKTTKRIIRPQLKSLSLFIALIKSKQITPEKFDLPAYMLVDDAEIKSASLLSRAERFKKISSLVANSEFLYSISTSKKNKDIVLQAKKHKTDNKAIYRLLNQYWKYGQSINALLPAYSNRGGKGKIRTNVQKSLGTRVSTRTGQFQPPNSYIVQEEDRNKFKKALNKYHLKPNGLNLKETYKNLLRIHYKYEIIDANYQDSIPGVPSYRQFINWSKKIISSVDFINSRTTELDYLRNKRGLETSITDRSSVPGSCFELDATVADVHIVSDFRRNHVIGRPTIYSIIDRASRMIVGFHVSLFYASWAAARQALANAFLPKAKFCRQFDIYIKDSDWPCCHIPQKLICDNGEMIGLQPQAIVTPLTELQFAPPYRAECKSLVERRFRYLNEQSIHRMIGTTRSGKIIKGEKDPRDRAIHTLQEVTSMLIKDVLEHNKGMLRDLALSSRMLIENNLAPTPLNFWNIHFSQHRHSLKMANTDEVIARLLPKAEVSMTRNGVLYNELYYSCKRIRDLELTTLARNNGRFKLEARIDHDNSSYLFVRIKDNEGFTRCELLDRSKELKSLPHSEILFLRDWLDNEEKKKPISMSSINVLEDKEKMQKLAQKLEKEAPKLKTKSEKKSNIKIRRAIERELMSTSIDDNSTEGGESIEQKYMKTKISLPRRRN
jgi:putative transposase